MRNKEPYLVAKPKLVRLINVHEITYRQGLLFPGHQPIGQGIFFLRLAHFLGLLGQYLVLGVPLFLFLFLGVNLRGQRGIGLHFLGGFIRGQRLDLNINFPDGVIDAADVFFLQSRVLRSALVAFLHQRIQFRGETWGLGPEHLVGAQLH